ncbi:MAG TPA: trypsin-like peptidase domain-containing protein [Thermoanaerobaculia bacterium]|nr:trypsin-like peptidase domain-containing protein [Thermoanaerobaculia bacterium]
MRRFLPLSAAALLLGCLVVLAALRLGPAPATSPANPVRGLTTPPTTDPAGQRERRTPVVVVIERISPAVVNISAESIVREADPFFGGFFGTRQRRAQSLGSGFIVDASGIVVTNAHVVQGASSITVTTLDGRELKAQVLGSDRDADLAVLKVDGKNLPAVPLGSSADLMIGETVIAIGNPFGLSHSVTTGVISARGRTVPSEQGERVFTDFLQTDASINPGNSGGPLVNILGQVIGINTAIVSGANGIGFAIPADRARRVVNDLLRFGELHPLWTGLRLLTVDPELARRNDLGAAHGAFVFKVYPSSPAAQAGLALGDVLTAIQGQPIASREDVITALYSLPEGTALQVAARRGTRAFDATLRPIRPPRDLGLRILAQGVGLEVSEERGALVVHQVTRRSAADRTGLEPGDVIIGANGHEVTKLDQLGEEVLRSYDRGGLPLVVQRGRFAYNLEFPLD